MNSWNDPRARELKRLQLALATFALQLDAFELRTDSVLRAIGRSGDADVMEREETKLPVNKVTWQQVGHVTEPGRYMFRFGWLTIAPDDLAVWTQFPDATFTLVQTSAPPLAAESDEPIADNEEFHLGAFELRAGSQPEHAGIGLRAEMPIEAQSSV